MSNLINFDFESNQLRTILIDNNPWFVAEDVCNLLSLTNPSMTLKSLDDDERSKLNLGRQGDVNIINESGLVKAKNLRMRWIVLQELEWQRKTSRNR